MITFFVSSTERLAMQCNASLTLCPYYKARAASTDALFIRFLLHQMKKRPLALSPRVDKAWTLSDPFPSQHSSLKRDT
jgi:hypothetical protein